MSDPALAHSTDAASGGPQAGHSPGSNRRRGRGWRASWGGVSIGCAVVAGLAAGCPGRYTVPHAAGQPIGIDAGWSLPGLVVDAGRVTGYLGVTLLIGTLAFWLLVWPSGRVDLGLIAMLWVGLLVTAVSAPVGVAGSLAIAAAADVPADLSTVLERPVAPLLARLAICAGLAAWLARHVPRRGTGTGAGDGAGGAGVVGGAAAGVMVLSLVLTIVAARPGRLPIPAVVLTDLHVLAAAGWVGGLAALAVAMVPRRDPAVLNATLGSFSWLSMACVATLAVTGTIHAWLHAGGLTALVSSPYGAALAAKLLAVVGMLSAATGSHAYVRRLRATPAPVQVVALFIGAELALGVAAMALTTALVAAAD